jgi:hypothetical protein
MKWTFERQTKFGELGCILYMELEYILKGSDDGV